MGRDIPHGSFAALKARREQVGGVIDNVDVGVKLGGAALHRIGNSALFREVNKKIRSVINSMPEKRRKMGN